jgi:hypothetical protein
MLTENRDSVAASATVLLTRLTSLGRESESSRPESSPERFGRRSGGISARYSLPRWLPPRRQKMWRNAGNSLGKTRNAGGALWKTLPAFRDKCSVTRVRCRVGSLPSRNTPRTKLSQPRESFDGLILRSDGSMLIDAAWVRPRSSLLLHSLGHPEWDANSTRSPGFPGICGGP